MSTSVCDMAEKSPEEPASNGNSNTKELTTFEKLLKLYIPSSKEHAKISERILLENFGGIPLTDEPEKALLKNIFLRPPSYLNEVESEGDNQKFINTLIMDKQNVADPASDRRNIVFVHGFMAGMGFYFKTLKAAFDELPEDGRIYAVDLLGMANSGRPPFPRAVVGEDWNSAQAIDFFLTSLEEWREAQEGLEEFILVAHSLGGYLATRYTLRYPGRVKKLILVSPVGIPKLKTDENWHPVTVAHYPKVIYFLWERNITVNWIVRCLGPADPSFCSSYVRGRFPYLSPEEVAILSDYFYHITANAGSGEYAMNSILAPGAWAREPLFDLLPNLQAPTTFIYGDVDWMDRTDAEEAVANMTVPTRIITIPSSSHYVFLDNPPLFNATLRHELSEGLALLNRRDNETSH